MVFVLLLRFNKMSNLIFFLFVYRYVKGLFSPFGVLPERSSQFLLPWKTNKQRRKTKQKPSTI
jgi:hypothetical protein